MNDIYKLKLHESIDSSGLKITRVPGGWIYMFWDYDKRVFYQTSTFVPFDNEYQKIES